jgi:hypothetical protein
MNAFHVAEKEKRAKPTDMFQDVYDTPTKNLERQQADLIEHLKLYKNEYPTDLFQKL